MSPLDYQATFAASYRLFLHDPICTIGCGSPVCTRRLYTAFVHGKRMKLACRLLGGQRTENLTREPPPCRVIRKISLYIMQNLCYYALAWGGTKYPKIHALSFGTKPNDSRRKKTTKLRYLFHPILRHRTNTPQCGKRKEKTTK